jgi:tetratricopeptide (TPR) repeat protein
MDNHSGDISVNSESRVLYNNSEWYERGQVLASQGAYGAALTSFDRALEGQPNNHEIWVFKSIILIHLEYYLEALVACDRALEIWKDSPQAWTLRGVALHRLDRYREAYTSYEKALGIRHHSPLIPLTEGLKGVWKSLIMKLYFNPQQDP